MVSVENLAFTAEAMFLSSDFQPTIEAVSVWDQRGTELAEPADITERLLGADGPGFALVRHTSAVRDWTDNADVRGNYYEEVLQLVQQMWKVRSTTKQPQHNQAAMAEDFVSIVFNSFGMLEGGGVHEAQAILKYWQPGLSD